MKDLIKRGFTLAEVIISIGIIAVVATMGFNITKNNIERAMDLYVYTGYKGISDAIADAYNSGLEPPKSITIDSSDEDKENYNEAVSNYAGHLIRVLNGENLRQPNASVPARQIAHFKTPNRISYLIENGNENNDDVLYINMKVPVKRRVENGTIIDTDILCFKYYIDDDTYNFIFPVDSYGVNNNFLTPYCKTTLLSAKKDANTEPSIRDRKDLLPFYLDDGLVGRVTNDSSGNLVYNPITYYSFNDATCKRFGPEKKLDLDTLSNCVVDQSQANSILRPENPRSIK